MTHVYAVDFETFYSKDCSITVQGPRCYFEHPDMEAYLVSIVGTCGLKWVGDPRGFDWSSIAGHHWISHNASFDETLYKIAQEQGWFGVAQHPALWDCSADLCAYHNWPRSLSGAIEYLYDISVDKGTRDRMRGERWDTMSPDFQKEVKDYAIKDSELCLKLWMDHHESWPLWERRVSRLNRKSLQRGIPVDSKRIQEGIHILAKQIATAEEEIPWSKDGERSPLSRHAFFDECRKNGIEPPPSLAMGNPEFEKWAQLHGEALPFVHHVQNYRRINSLHQKAIKLQNGISDGRYYGGIMYCGAHTRRFSGSGANFNLQNIPKGDYETGELFGVNFRSFFRARPGFKFIIADLGQIEIRTLMWMARHTEMLKRIAASDDIYHPLGVQLGMWSDDKGPLRSCPKTRHTVKAMCLGAQFGASGAAYHRMTGAPLKESHDAVQLYRTRMPEVVAFWNRLERGINLSIRKGEDYEIALPSGNVLAYRNLRRMGSGVVCDVVRGGKVMTMRPWPGLLAENCAQALARDVFSYLMLGIEVEGKPWQNLFHVHDEYVIECPEDHIDEGVAHVEKVITTPPDWITDPILPLACEIIVSDIYTK